jgi:hypothetical protein
LADRVYYRDRAGDIEITTTRAVFGSKAYAVNGITSSEVIKIPPDRLIPILVLAGGFCAIAFIGYLISRTDPGALKVLPTVVGMVASAIVAGLACTWLVLQRTHYAVELCTAAREVQALVTFDSEEATDIANAINKAISDRG